jgi:hypothetical protein
MATMTLEDQRSLNWHIGRALRRHRKLAEYSAVGAARDAGIAESAFRMVESGNRGTKLWSFVRHCEAIEADPVEVLAEALKAFSQRRAVG